MIVEIFGTPSCKFCGSAKKLVESKGLEYTYTDISDLEERANLALRMGFTPRSVPQIFADNKYIGGYNELKVLLAV